MSELSDRERIIKDLVEIEQFLVDFYRMLYANNPCVEANQEAQEICFRSVPRVVTDEMNAKLTLNFTIEEVKEALRQIPTRKVPRHDTINPPKSSLSYGNTQGLTFVNSC